MADGSPGPCQINGRNIDESEKIVHDFGHGCGSGPGAGADRLCRGELVVVATPASFAKAADWQKFLGSKKIPIKNVAPSNLAAFKDAPYVVLLGALDEAGGIKPLAEKALIKSEFDKMKQPGSSAMFVKSNVWSQGQEVIIFTGAGDKGVETARKGQPGGMDGCHLRLVWT